MKTKPVPLYDRMSRADHGVDNLGGPPEVLVAQPLNLTLGEYMHYLYLPIWIPDGRRHAGSSFRPTIPRALDGIAMRIPHTDKAFPWSYTCCETPRCTSLTGWFGVGS